MDQFQHRIATLSHETYEKKVFKKGKPQKGKEWTLMAAILLEKRDSKNSPGNMYCLTYCYWWLVRVTLVVDWRFLPQNLGPWWGHTKAYGGYVNADGVGIVLEGSGDT